MYIPKSHRGLSTKAAIAFARKYSFATVSAIVSKQIEHVHVPIEIQSTAEKLLLTSHIAKGNKLTQAILDGGAATVIFSQPHAYVSSSWYDHVNVPTWNYISIQMRGSFRVLLKEEMMAALSKMVEQYESGRADRFRISDMSEEQLHAHLQGLTAFELEVAEVEANYKLSQNRNDKNYTAIIEQLQRSDFPWEREIANEMLLLRPAKKESN